MSKKKESNKNNENQQGFEVLNPGVLSLIQDTGRFGFADHGLSNGGPVDSIAFNWANRILQNHPDATCIEISIGGLVLKSQVHCGICVTGAVMPFTINGIKQTQWQAIQVKPGDVIAFSYASQGLRAYLSVSFGFQVQPSFGSTATVLREKIGGLNGTQLCKGELLASKQQEQVKLLYLPLEHQVKYHSNINLRVVLGYQTELFSDAQRSIFFNSSYKVSKHYDRMGYRLSGHKVTCHTESLLSEGICLGAIQIPPDGQPIVLLNDRQTMGGYPKIGSVLSLDLAKLSQCSAGANVTFSEISVEQAQDILQQAQVEFYRTPLLIN